MRPPKSRSRSKSNRQRSMGNIVNRVFESSGPEGKVRGTPQQIIEKYNQLARDAQVANDRVAAENFQQHAEHYARMLHEAQREQDARREQQEASHMRERARDWPVDRNEDISAQPVRALQPDGGGNGGGNGAGEVIDLAENDSQSTLVETPEEKPAEPTEKPARPRRPRKPRAAQEGEADKGQGEAQAPAAE